MATPTMKLRLFYPLIKVGVVQDGPLEGNYIWDHAETPTLQQWFDGECGTGAWFDVDVVYQGTKADK